MRFFLLFFVFLFRSLFAYDGPLLTPEELKARGPISHDSFVLNGIPKCGTHLIIDCLHYALNKEVDAGYDGYFIQEETFTGKIAKGYLAYLITFKDKPFIHKTHVPYFRKMEKTLVQAGMKWLFFIRDPRDALASLLVYMEKIKADGDFRDFMEIDSKIYDDLSMDEKLEALMTGSCCTSYMKKFLKGFHGWTQIKKGLVLRFEDLIGPRGGGSLEKQLKVLKKISSYLNFQLSYEEMLAVAEYTNNTRLGARITEVFGLTFVGGQIGNWPLFFNEENKALFKKLYGKELIKLGYETSDNW